MIRSVTLRRHGRYLVLWVGGYGITDGAETIVGDRADERDGLRAARRTARAALQALGMPGRDVRRLCGLLHAHHAPGAHAPRRGPGPPRAVMPALEWVDVLACPVPAPVRVPRRLRVRAVLW